MSDATAFRFAARHPEYVVLVSCGSSQGDHWWHVRPDGTTACESAACGRPTTRREHREIVSAVAPKYLDRATHYVYLHGDRPLRVGV